MLSRIATKKQRGRRLLTALAALSVVTGTLVITSSVLAVHNTGVFQMDGNAQTSVDSTPSAAEDWDLICKAHPSDCTPVTAVPAGTTTATSSSFTKDGVDASIFTGGGSKDPQDLPNWKWKDGSVPDKDNLQDAFAARYTTTASSTCPNGSGPTFTGTCDLLYFGSDRFDNSGDAQQGFWFFQHKVVAAANGTFQDASGAPATHTIGDILIVSDFSNGGGTSTINVYTWTAAGLTFRAGGPVAKCDPIGATDPFCGLVNPTNGTPAPWTFLEKNGLSTYLQGEFYEAGLNLSDPSINLANECFSSFLSETRSSTSTTATLKDFVLGQLAPCGASIQINPPTDVNAVGATHTFTVHVTKTVGGATVPAQGVFPTVTLTATNGAVISNVVDNCANTPPLPSGTNASGDCTVTFTSNSAGVVTGHAAASVVISGSTFLVETDGTGTNSGDAVKRFVDARIALSPLTATNAVNSPHTITATVTQNDGLPAGAPGDAVTGFGPAPNGTVVTFNLLNNTAGAAFTTVAPFTCTTSGGTGTCTIQINTSTAGSVDIHATTTFSVGGESLTRATTGTLGNSVNANKVYVDAQIDLSPLTATNNVGTAHTIEAFVQQDDGLPAAAVGSDGVTGFTAAPAGTLVTFSLLNNTAGAAFTTPAPFTCTTIGTTGKCTIQINSSTAGSVDIHATTTFSVGGVSLTRATGTGGNNSADANKVYVAGSIAWKKVDNAGVKQGGATFDLCKTHNYNLATGEFDLITPPPACTSVVDNSAPDTDTDPGDFLVTGLTLGRYTVHETAAPAGFDPDLSTATVEVTPTSPNADITSTPFVNKRPVLKISGFGYTNVAANPSAPTSGVLSGTTVFTFTLHNYGNGAAVLDGSSLVVNSNATCIGGNTLNITGSIAAGGNYAGTNSLTCSYLNLTDGDAVTATLTVKTLTNGTTREASGSPAVITFHVQGD